MTVQEIKIENVELSKAIHKLLNKYKEKTKLSPDVTINKVGVQMADNFVETSFVVHVQAII